MVTENSLVRQLSITSEITVLVLGNILTDKDMGKNELTWQDIQRIVRIADQIVDEDRRKFMAMEDEDYYKEVLARYVKQSEKP